MPVLPWPAKAWHCGLRSRALHPAQLTWCLCHRERHFLTLGSRERGCRILKAQWGQEGAWTAWVPNWKRRAGGAEEQELRMDLEFREMNHFQDKDTCIPHSRETGGHASKFAENQITGSIFACQATLKSMHAREFSPS